MFGRTTPDGNAPREDTPQRHEVTPEHETEPTQRQQEVPPVADGSQQSPSTVSGETAADPSASAASDFATNPSASHQQKEEGLPPLTAAERDYLAARPLLAQLLAQHPHLRSSLIPAEVSSRVDGGGGGVMKEVDTVEKKHGADEAAAVTEKTMNLGGKTNMEKNNKGDDSDDAHTTSANSSLRARTDEYLSRLVFTAPPTAAASARSPPTRCTTEWSSRAPAKGRLATATRHVF